MSFTRVKPAGWAFGEQLTSAQANALDTDHANAIDGAAGGSYSPSSAIIIGGAGIRMSHARYAISGTGVTPGSKFTLTETVDVGGYALASDEIEVPEAGDYLVATHAFLTTSDASSGAGAIVIVRAGSTFVIDLIAQRYSTSTSDGVLLSGTGVVVIATPSTQKIKVSADASNSGNLTMGSSNGLSIMRIG